jgi:hypothetical protein
MSIMSPLMRKKLCPKTRNIKRVFVNLGKMKKPVRDEGEVQ